MNVGGNYRYATAGADTEMASWAAWQLLGDRLRRQCGCGSAFGDDEAAAAAAVEFSAAHSGDVPAGGGARAAQYNPLRRAALRPGGPLARRFFARHPTVLQVGSTLFVHGGVLPPHVEYGLGRINDETQAWLMGGSPHAHSGAGSSGATGAAAGGGAAEGKQGGSGGGAAAGAAGAGTAGIWSWFGSKWRGTSSQPVAAATATSAAAALQQQQQRQRPHPHTPPAFLRGAHAVVWARDYSARDEARCDCEMLSSVLEAVPGAKRMVVGHTIQEGGITSACGGRVFRVDVGMSKGCGDGEPEVLEILSDRVVRRLTEDGAPEVMGGAPAPAGQPHQPHHLTGPAVDTPAGAWGEALQRLRGAFGEGLGRWP
ncbi:Uncharacterized protein MNEG_2066 [Monoraphidium neglectum]|uniref:Calcineurin-like phosphoesterase domain-containing protein n=1 Tax=Monoraphidium neglectum TaxID=145388 RepID=A0A0D2MZZ8_9CHLO|nr:Uncharacterized protein MNEG_2066 [Monoraphidium neglectum]KIZ05887.1 Uncharacterized protein MNEG_2066 [Monoraphidium neglectum]|eukprot:XP_013904906.1 Uncharacterized protein MNEG_2066 [Monoraphidium neglectum]